ncbi:MAG: methionyl-tRNA formyltransferase [Planctomycetota bacterium]|nr:methionyl-tRNA formyltransferase [Planctomycetota bacterium]
MSRVVNGKLGIVFLGTSSFGLPSLRALQDDGHVILSVVTQPDRPRGRGRKPSPTSLGEAASSQGLPLLRPEKIRDIKADLERLSPDVLVVAAYGQFLPTSIIRTPRLAALNIHASLLPRYRGAAPIQWAIVNGETETGITIFRIVKKMDAGPILATRRTAIDEMETAGELEERLASMGAELMVETLSDLPAALVKERPQDESAITYAPRLQREDGHLSFDRPAKQILDRVRGLSPRPGAYGDLVRPGIEPERLRVLEANPEVPGTDDPPGLVILADGNGILVAATDGAVRITMVQAAGGRSMSAAAYLRGHPVARGARFV